MICPAQTSCSVENMPSQQIKNVFGRTFMGSLKGVDEREAWFNHARHQVAYCFLKRATEIG